MNTATIISILVLTTLAFLFLKRKQKNKKHNVAQTNQSITIEEYLQNFQNNPHREPFLFYQEFYKLNPNYNGESPLIKYYKIVLDPFEFSKFIFFINKQSKLFDDARKLGFTPSPAIREDISLQSQKAQNQHQTKKENPNSLETIKSELKSELQNYINLQTINKQKGDELENKVLNILFENKYSTVLCQYYDTQADIHYHIDLISKKDDKVLFIQCKNNISQNYTYTKIDIENSFIKMQQYYKNNIDKYPESQVYFIYLFSKLDHTVKIPQSIQNSITQEDNKEINSSIIELNQLINII